MLFTNNPMDDNNQRCYYRIAFAENRFNRLTDAERYRLVAFMVRLLLPGVSLTFTRFQDEPYRVGKYDAFSNTILVNTSLLLAPTGLFYSYDLYAFLYLLSIQRKTMSKKRAQEQCEQEEIVEEEKKVKETKNRYQAFVVEELSRLLNFYNIVKLENAHLSQYIQEIPLFHEGQQQVMMEEGYTVKLGR